MGRRWTDFLGVTDTDGFSSRRKDGIGRDRKDMVRKEKEAESKGGGREGKGKGCVFYAKGISPSGVTVRNEGFSQRATGILRVGDIISFFSEERYLK